MAGFWSGSFTNLPDVEGKPRISAKAYFYAASTSTPITVYQNNDLSVPHPNPVVTDGNGNFPAVFFDEADGFYRVRTTTSSGVVVYDSPAIPIIGPTGSGGGSTTPVDPNAVMNTGDMMIRFGSETRAGFVRLNGRSIGSALSGAEERANSDTQPLYVYLWNVSTSIVITGGRGGSGAADFSANKPLILPDWRGRALIGLDTMGNTAAGRVASATAIGWSGGEEKHTLTLDEIPSHSHTVTDPGHVHGVDYRFPIYINDTDRGSPGASSLFDLNSFNSLVSTVNATTGISLGASGGGLAHNVVQPSGALSVYMRL